LLEIPAVPKTQAAIVYFRVPGLDARLSLVTELVKAVLPKPARKNGGHTPPNVRKWIDLDSAIKDKLGIRRRIAHHPVRTSKASFSFEGTDAFKGEGFSFSWFELHVSDHEIARGRDAKPQILLITDLVDHDTAVLRLADELKSFYEDVLIKHIPESDASVSPRDTHSSKDSPTYSRPTKRKPRPKSPGHLDYFGRASSTAKYIIPKETTNSERAAMTLWGSEWHYRCACSGRRQLLFGRKRALSERPPIVVDLDLIGTFQAIRAAFAFLVKFEAAGINLGRHRATFRRDTARRRQANDRGGWKS
jgi:hypothetical protein